MPFQANQAIEQKILFVQDCEGSGQSFSQLCERYHISRVTGYKWLERYEEEGVDGLWERSRAPHQVAHALSEALQELIVQGREDHPSWGPRKLLAWLQAHYPRRPWCVASTIGELLRRQRLTQARVIRRQSVPRVGALAPCERPNQVWCTDFKGWFVLGNRQRCEPWTLSDGWSRYLLRVKALAQPTLQAVWDGLEAAFREYGLPEVIRSDNGRPFAGLGPGGLSQLAVWWIRLGIRPERIEPGKPQENGRHERMHRTLLEAIRPPGRTLRGQQQRFGAFVREFNEERPHEALGQRTPASVYESSPRAYPRRLPPVEYEAGVVVKRVYEHGDIHWQGRRLFLSQALAGEEVGFEGVEDGRWRVRFGPVALGTWDERKRRLENLRQKEAQD